MANRKEEARFALDQLRECTHVRCDCPFCGGKHTYSATRDGRRVSWNCFRAGCDVRGHMHVDPTISDLRKSLEEKEQASGKPISEKPGSWVSPLREPKAVAYLKKYHCFRALERGLAKIYWDVATERVVFAITNEADEIVDAASRRISGKEGPKWLRYHHGRGIGEPFVTKPVSDDCPVIVVEDCASACAVAPWAVGVALLGTHLSAGHVARIRKLGRRTYVALDPDATKKGITIARQLSFVVPAEAVKLVEEFKNLPEKETEEWISFLVKPTVQS